MATDLSKSRRIELILRQLDSLPTLPAVAVRLLSLTARDDTDARQIVEVVSMDQVLTAKILSLCRRSDVGLRDEAMTIDKAVVLLGFGAIRNAALSLKVFEYLDANDPQRIEHSAPGSAASEPGRPPGSDPGALSKNPATTPWPATAHFDRQDFWRHCIAVGVACELIAKTQPGATDFTAGEAFVCGLLHDIGKVALDYLLPKSFARVVELVEINQGNIAEFERRVIGIDHNTAGKRLAEQWQLPHRLQDCIWLHGQPLDTLPRIEHRRLVGLVTLGDLIARRQHIGYSGNFAMQQDPMLLTKALGFDTNAVEKAMVKLHDEVAKRVSLLGLDEKPTQELLFQSIQNANAALGKLNSALDRRTHVVARQSQALDTITAFYSSAAPGRNVLDTLASVVQSASHLLGSGFFCVLHQPSAGQPWLVAQFDAQGREQHHQLVDAPPKGPDLVSINVNEPLTMGAASIVPWITDYLTQAPDVRNVRILPLPSGWGTAALLLHDRPTLPPWRELSAVTATWGSAIAAAGQHDGARRIGEDLAQANQALAQTQDRLLRTESMARLGEMAAGAAHEMNNPLAVISGRSQLLAMSLPAGSNEAKAVQTISEQAHRLSDLITALRTFADPPKPNPKPTDITKLLQEAVKQASLGAEPIVGQAPIALQIRPPMPEVSLDGEQILQALRELLLNALQSTPKTPVQLTAQIDSTQRRLIFQVSDDGVGMDEHTLAHAMDPFFSNKPAGRRVGMGLPKAQQLASGHNGHVELRSMQGVGSVATLWIPLDSHE